MKKVINLKEMLIIFMVVAIVAISTNVFATSSDLVLGDTNTTVIPGNEYENALTIPDDENQIGNNTTNNTTTNNIVNNKVTNNTVKKYNTSNTTDLPQTGIEDYNVGILLIICVISAMYAYKKVNDYKNV